MTTAKERPDAVGERVARDPDVGGGAVQAANPWAETIATPITSGEFPIWAGSVSDNGPTKRNAMTRHMNEGMPTPSMIGSTTGSAQVKELTPARSEAERA